MNKVKNDDKNLYLHSDALCILKKNILLPVHIQVCFLTYFLNHKVLSIIYFPNFNTGTNKIKFVSPPDSILQEKSTSTITT